MAPQGGSERPRQKGEDENIPKTIRAAGLRWAKLHPHIPLPCPEQLPRLSCPTHGGPALPAQGRGALGMTRTCAWLKFFSPQINTFLKKPLGEVTAPPSFSSARA